MSRGFILMHRVIKQMHMFPVFFIPVIQKADEGLEAFIKNLRIFRLVLHVPDLHDRFFRLVAL